MAKNPKSKLAATTILNLGKVGFSVAVSLAQSLPLF